MVVGCHFIWSMLYLAYLLPQVVPTETTLFFHLGYNLAAVHITQAKNPCFDGIFHSFPHEFIFSVVHINLQNFVSLQLVAISSLKILDLWALG